MPVPCHSLLLVLLVSGLAWGQAGKPPKASKPPATPNKGISEPPPTQGDVEADQAVEENRDFARRMPVKPRGPLGAWEQERVKVFREAKSSVVHVTTLGPRAYVTPRYTLDERVVPVGTGSGFVWDHAGHVVTNYHVIQSVVEATREAKEKGQTGIEVKLSDGSSFWATPVGYSPSNDIAVLHVMAPLSKLKPLQAGRVAELSVGQSVLAIGNPFGLDHSMSQGIVSALGRELPTGPSTSVKGVIQTDAAINPGNSGGPLLDSAGRLIGMNTWIAPATGASVGIGFAIPVDRLQEVVPKLIAKARLVDQLYFGFQAMFSGDAAEKLLIPRGVVVDMVDPGGPAEKAGLRAWKIDHEQRRVIEVGDVIVRCQGVPVESATELMGILETLPKGKPLELGVLRGQTLETIIITPERRALSPEGTPIQPRKESKEI